MRELLAEMELQARWLGHSGTSPEDNGTSTLASDSAYSQETFSC
jgi:hypothetical protein